MNQAAENNFDFVSGGLGDPNPVGWAYDQVVDIIHGE